MIPIVAITFVLVMSFLFSCNKNYPIPDEISKAQALMLERPDSALLILEGMKGVEHLPAKLKATYNLCLIEARDKNYIVHTSDSLINTVVAFFEKEDDPLMKAKAYYYQGR
ncbi:MAG: tetratricopeptide repeat protein, partial [Macellibacteroides fermentans]